MLENLLYPSWHWSVSGAAIALVLVLLTLAGRTFGVSSTFRNICGLTGAGKRNDFFSFDPKQDGWRLYFMGGAILGGYLAGVVFPNTLPVALYEDTLLALKKLGMIYPDADTLGHGFFPDAYFRWDHAKAWLVAISGGFLIGFGSRYADGCTSGHAITGLSHFQLPSFLTVIGFFIGGLIMTHFLLPYIL
jgi:uncharacterized membrane protein YedE/YeeE